MDIECLKMLLRDARKNGSSVTVTSGYQVKSLLLHLELRDLFIKNELRILEECSKDKEKNHK